MPMPLVHMIEPLITFFTKLISAMFDEPLESLIRNIPDLNVILPLNNKEMKMSVGEYIAYEMGKPESPYKSSYNMILNYRALVKEIEEQNAAIQEIILKEQKEQEYFDLLFEYFASVAMRLDSLDQLDEEQRLAAQAMRVAEYLSRLANTYTEYHAKYMGLYENYTSTLTQYNQAKEDMYKLASEQNSKHTQFYVDHYTAQINKTREQISKIDEKINFVDQKYSLVEKELVSLRDGSQPADPGIIQSKQKELDQIKEARESLDKIKSILSETVVRQTETLDIVKELDRDIEEKLKVTSADPIALLSAKQVSINGINDKFSMPMSDANLKIQQLYDKQPALAQTLGNIDDFLLKQEAPDGDLLNALLNESVEKIGQAQSKVIELGHQADSIKTEMDKVKLEMHNVSKEFRDNSSKILPEFDKHTATKDIAQEIRKLNGVISHHHPHTHEKREPWEKNRHSQLQLDQSLNQIHKNLSKKDSQQHHKDRNIKPEDASPAPRKGFPH